MIANISLSPQSRSRSFAPKKQNKQRDAARTNSCLARYICLPEMSVRDEIKWARRSIKLYREFSQLSTVSCVFIYTLAFYLFVHFIDTFGAI